jgi:hypothetical protein
VATIIYHAPQAIRMRIACFALSGKVFLLQADHVSSRESAYNIRVGSVTSVFLLIKLMSLVRNIFRK